MKVMTWKGEIRANESSRPNPVTLKPLPGFPILLRRTECSQKTFQETPFPAPYSLVVPLEEKKRVQSGHLQRNLFLWLHDEQACWCTNRCVEGRNDVICMTRPIHLPLLRMSLPRPHEHIQALQDPGLCEIGGKQKRKNGWYPEELIQAIQDPGLCEVEEGKSNGCTQRNSLT